MLKVILTAALAVAATGVASAQSNVLKVNVLSPLVRTGSFFYERQLTPHSSAQLGALVTNFSLDKNSGVTGFAITPEYRFYLSEKTEGLQGFYIAPFMRYQHLALTTRWEEDGMDAETSLGLNTVGGGLLVGHQWLFRQHFSLDLFLGPCYNSGEGQITADSEAADIHYKEKANIKGGPFTGFGLRSGITFGLAF